MPAMQQKKCGKEETIVGYQKSLPRDFCISVYFENNTSGTIGVVDIVLSKLKSVMRQNTCHCDFEASVMRTRVELEWW